MAKQAAIGIVGGMMLLRFRPDDPPGEGDPAGNGDPTPGPGGGGGGDDPWAEVAKWGTPTKVLDALRASRRWEDRAKENKAKADKWDEYERQNQSESERHAAELADAQRKAQEAEARAMRLEVATAKGLTPAQAKRLQGATQEELEADADDLLATFKGGNGEHGGGDEGDGDGVPTGFARRPQEAPRPGGRPGAQPAITPKEVVDRVLGQSR